MLNSENKLANIKNSVVTRITDDTKNIIYLKPSVELMILKKN